MWNPYRLRRKWSQPGVFSTLHAALISKEITIPAASLLLLHTGSSGGFIPDRWLQAPVHRDHHRKHTHIHTHSCFFRSKCNNNKTFFRSKSINQRDEGTGRHLSLLHGFLAYKGVEHKGGKKRTVTSLFLIKAVAPFSLIRGWSCCTRWIWPLAAALFRCGSA